MNAEPLPQQIPRISEVMPGAYCQTPFSHPPPSHYQTSSVYPPFLPADPRIPGPIPITHAPGHGQKRLAQPHPSETPAKKKQAKWSADEDKAIIELRGNGMKWEDISKRLPNRSAISCRLRFQNYLERRPEWDEEKKNKLARLYERFREDMWKGIAKEMQIPWRAAENMHWQMGELEIAQRANVQPFQLAGQQPPSQGGAMPERVPSTSPPSGRGLPSSMPYSHTHTHSLPQVSLPQPQMLSPAYSRTGRSPNGSSPNGPLQRGRADSATSVPTSTSNLLPPIHEATSHSTPPGRYILPPVRPPSETRGR